jgi:hypothetical protein
MATTPRFPVLLISRLRHGWPGMCAWLKGKEPMQQIQCSNQYGHVRGRGIGSRPDMGFSAVA